MNIFGIGPALALTGLGGFALFFALDSVFGIKLALHGVPRAIALTIGLALALRGIYFWAASIIQIARGSHKNKLLAAGVYSLTRNPMYAAFIVFLVPAIALTVNNLLFLIVPALMYQVFKRKIILEEEFLLKTFGGEYKHYCERTPRLLPGFSRRRK